MHQRNHEIIAVLVISWGLSARGLAQEPAPVLDDVRAAASRQAAELVSPSIVRIESTGGLERVDDVLAGTGPTSGLIVAADGWIISSAFGLANKPSGILVTLPDGERIAGRVVAVDYSRMLTLLKVDAKNLPVPEPLAKSQVRVGQSVLALGKTWDPKTPSLAMGIVSAVGRVWGKAIQTDAKVSPINYGGPLVDMEGRVLGVLVPLDPNGTSPTAGFQWYDAGIGFAIPLEDILAALPRLQQGDLRPGLVGITIKSDDPFGMAPFVERVAWRSPARLSGIEAKDVIISADGQAVAKQADFMQEIGNKYAGDSVRLGVRRGEKDLEFDLTLVASLPKYSWPLLGMWVEPTAEGLKVLDVLKELPAEQGKLAVGDVIRSANGKEVKSWEDMRRELDELLPGETVELSVQRGEQAETIKVPTSLWPEKVPELPASDASVDPKAPFEEKSTTNKTPYWLFAPPVAEESASRALVMYFEGARAPKREVVLERWREACVRHGIFLVGVRPAKGDVWSNDDVGRVEEIIQEVVKTHDIDDRRLIMHGAMGAAPFVEEFTRTHRRLVRGLSLVGANGVRPTPTEPEERLTLHLCWSEKDGRRAGLEANAKALNGAGYPVYGRARAFPVGGYLTAEMVEEIARWTRLLSAL